MGHLLQKPGLNFFGGILGNALMTLIGLFCHLLLGTFTEHLRDQN
uniref:Uncharacterized protein n=1 Tax=Arundo donax TaxID=35708 RepID=A0A0A9GGN5_ARUDO